MRARIVSSLGACAVAAWAASARAQDPNANPSTSTSASSDPDAAAGAGEVVTIDGAAPEEAKPTSYDVTGDEIRAIPGAANDTLRALQGLPGVARIPFSFGGLVLRGTSPRDSHVFLDGIEVPIAFHFGGVTSFYPSALLDRVELTNGGFGAEYGRGLGGMVALTTRAARTDRWRVGSEVSLIDSSVHADGPAGGGGLTIAVRRSYIDAILGAVMSPDERVLPRYYDAQLAWTTGDPRARAGELTALLFYSDDQVSTDDHDRHVTLSSWFVRASARWVRQVGATRLTITPWAGADVLAFTGPLDTPTGRQPLDATQRRVTLPGGLRAAIVRDTSWGHLAGGVDVRAARAGQLSTDVLGSGLMTAPTETDDLTADAGAWVEALWRIGGHLDVRPGLRVDHFGATGETVIDPRLSTSVALADGLTLRQAIGLYHQPPLHGDLDPTTGNPALRSSWSAQASLGVDAALPDDVALSVTGYAVDEGALPIAVTNPTTGAEPIVRSEGGLGPIFLQLLDAQLGSMQYRANVGRAKSLGVEVSIKRHVGPLLAWLSYTYGRAYRTDDPAARGGWRPYELDQPHNLTAIVATQVGAWQLGARLRVSSGDPYTPRTEVVDDMGYTSQIVGAPFSERLPTFVALDLRVDRLWTRRWGTIDAYLDVQNATNRANVEGLSVITADGPEYTHGLPILPVIGVAYTPR